MSPNFEMDFDHGFHDLTHSLNVTPSAEQAHAVPLQNKRERNRFSKSSDAGKAVAKKLEAHLKNLQASNPELFAESNIQLSVISRPKSKPGASKILLALIDLVLTPDGAAMTQTGCRAKVHAAYPGHSVFKDWTKPLPKWALEHAAKKIKSSAPEIASIKTNSKTALRDIHSAARSAFAGARSEGEVFKTTIAMYPDSVVINGTRFELRTNKTNGHEYVMLRISQAALLSALR